ncbi:MAG: sigma 54-interacting transcriptional regulator [Gemmatimonadaceae bacterium]
MTIALGAQAPLSQHVHAMVGESEPMRRLKALIETVAPTRLPVLIYGPTGSGKELVASAIHALSRRRGAFVPFNVCAISETMFEDALFGHVRGAFTGAMNDVPGFLREADGGTVFLDEVSGLPPVLQAKLLRAIETGVFRPVGAKRDVQSDFRVVAATNESLEGLVGQGRFRADFAHRIGAVTVSVPTLAERREDIPLLVRHFLAGIGSGHVKVADAAIDVLAEHHWPGNVRELKHVVEWSAAFSNGHLSADTLRAAVAQRTSVSPYGIGADALERNELRAILERLNWNADLVAEQLGVHRSTLYRRMRRLGLMSS